MILDHSGEPVKYQARIKIGNCIRTLEIKVIKFVGPVHSTKAVRFHEFAETLGGGPVKAQVEYLNWDASLFGEPPGSRSLPRRFLPVGRPVEDDKTNFILVEWLVPGYRKSSARYGRFTALWLSGAVL
jgi:hypothetical protein